MAMQLDPAKIGSSCETLSWQLAGLPSGTTGATTRLHTCLWVCPGVVSPLLGLHTVMQQQPPELMRLQLAKTAR